MYKKIKDNTSLVRDTSSNAILNTNPDEYIAAKQRQNRAKRERKEIKELKSEIADLRSILNKLIINSNNHD